MKKLAILTVALVAINWQVTAQNEVEAIRYSVNDLPATGRSLGMGGAFGAIGADLSNFFSNPAGIGAYKRRDIGISFALHDVNSKSSYMQVQQDNARTRFNMNTIGIVGHKDIENSEWKSVNWGFAHGKTNNFYQNISIKGKSNGTSLMDQFAGQAEGIDPDQLLDAIPFTSGLAYQVYAIDPGDSLGSYYQTNSYTGDILQNKSINRTGVQSESAFGIGGNYKDVLLVGMTLNFQSVRFKDISSFSEEFENNSDNFLSRYSYNETLYSDGTGVGVKLGAIVMPTPWVRVGLAYHSPTRISFTESYTADMNSKERVGGGQWTQTSPTLVTEYLVRTPSKLMANLALVIGKTGVFSVDYEYANYDRIRMSGTRTNSYGYSDENDAISELYHGTHKVKAGVELRALEAWYVRAGAVYQQSPFINGVGAITTPRMSYTGGIGYRSDYFFVDVAGAFTTGKEYYYMYSPSLVEPATIQTNRFMGVVSFGMRY